MSEAWCHGSTDEQYVVVCSWSCVCRKNVVERSILRHRAEINLANRISYAIPRIAGSIRIARIRRFRHPYSDEAHWNRASHQPQRLRSPFSRFYGALKKRLPHSSRRRMNRVFATRPILHLIDLRERFSPRDPDAVHLLHLREIEQRPTVDATRHSLP